MGYFSTAERRGSLENPSTSLSNPAAWLVDWASGRKTKAGARISEGTALELSAVWRAVNAIASQIATLPFPVYRRLQPRGKERVPSHRIYRLLHDRPNPEMTPATFVDVLQGHLLTWGNAYAEIERDAANRPLHLWPITPDRVQVKRVGGRKVYIVKVGGQYIRLEQEDMLHVPGPGFDGLVGYSPISLARESLGLTKAVEEFGAYYFGNGSRASGVVQHPKTLSDVAQRNFRESWADMHQGLENSHRIAILEEGMTWQQIGIPPEDAQFLETRKFQTVEVARWFGIPPHKLYDLERATFSNIEQQSLEFDRDTLRPWVVRWEQTVNWDLFGPIERGRFFAEFVMDGVLRADSETRGKFYQTGIRSGWLSIDDIREKENLNPVPGGDRYFVQRDMMPLDKVDDVVAAETAPEPAPQPAPASDDADRAARAVETRDARELRAVNARLSLRRDYAGLFEEAADSTVKKEVVAIRAALKKAYGGRDAGKLRELVDEFYDSHDEWVAERFLALLRSYARRVAVEAAREADGAVPESLDAFMADYARTFGRRWTGSSANQLRQLIADTDPDEVEAVIAGRLDEWEEGRASKEASREVVEAGEAVTALVYGAIGVTVLKWRTSGGSCPLCKRLNGRTVGVEEFFVREGDTVDPEDGETAPLTSKINVRHPPLHRGCDCAIVPG